MSPRQRRRITLVFFSCVISSTFCMSVEPSEKTTTDLNENFENNIIDFDEDYSIKFNKKYGVPWDSNENLAKEMHRYTLVKDKDSNNNSNLNVQNNTEITSLSVEGTTSMNDYSVIPLELISTTEDELSSIIDSTTEQDLTVIPLSTTKKAPVLEIKQTVTLPTSTQTSETTTEYELDAEILTKSDSSETTTSKREVTTHDTSEIVSTVTSTDVFNVTTTEKLQTENKTEVNTTAIQTKRVNVTTVAPSIERKNNKSKHYEVLKTNSSMTVVNTLPDSSETHEDVPNFSELDTSDETEVPEDYYDSKDVIPTPAPKNDALSVIFGLAGGLVESVVESVAERVVPKSLYDLFKRMQRQNEALEAERLRSREENGGLGQFGRGILKTISSGLSKPLSQLMQGAKDIGSLDSDRGFVSSVASGVTSVANVATSVAEAFKDRVQAIYPGTVWCGDGHSASARSSDLGLFFFTDTCCRQHDACKIYIRAGDTKYGLTNTGLFTRSHCSCDAKFRECLRKTNSLVSAQIGLTYFNVLGPQCFRKAHPIVRCVRRTRITGQKCEEYELDYTKPKMWQWFDNETF